MEDEFNARTRLALIFQAAYGAVAFLSLLSAAIVVRSPVAFGIALAGVGCVVLSQTFQMIDLRERFQGRETGWLHAAFVAWCSSIGLAAASFIVLCVGF